MSSIGRGAKGVILRLTVTDHDRTPIDLSTAQEVVFVANGGRGRSVLSHTFTTDGSDGRIDVAIPVALTQVGSRLDWQVKVTLSADDVHWSDIGTIPIRTPL